MRVYKDGKLVKDGDEIASVYLDASNNVIGKSANLDGTLPPNSVAIENISDNLYLVLSPVGRNPDFHHKLKSGEGRNIEDYEKIYDIDHLRKSKVVEIDLRTEEISDQGFSFSGSLFSSSLEDQKNWMALYVAQDKLTYPFFVTTKEGGTYEFQSPQELTAFYLTGLQVVYVIYSGARFIKGRVLAASTKEELDAIVDSR